MAGETDKDEEVIINPLDLPDDEIDNVVLQALDEPEVDADADAEGDDTSTDGDAAADDDDDGATDDSNDEDDKSALDAKDSEVDGLAPDAAKANADKAVEGDVDPDKATADADKDAADVDKDAKDGDTKDADPDTSKLDFEAEHKKLLEPFRANGKEMKIDNVDDARQLMQMGANYNKKMAAIKPNLRLIKMLDNNGLLDESKLSFLIDLDKKDPEAIKKLVKDAGIDPLEIDKDGENDYKPSTYTVNDKEVELDSILEDIRDTKSYADTIDIIGNKWDKSSKQVLLDQPEIIKLINDHVSTGVYAQIQSEMDTERMMGRLKGMSDLEAYKTVGDAIHARGGFDTQPEGEVDKTTETKPVVKKAEKVDPKIRERKKAAGSTKSTTSNKGKDSFDPLAMSDEDFEKAATGKFL